MMSKNEKSTGIIPVLFSLKKGGKTMQYKYISLLVFADYRLNGAI